MKMVYTKLIAGLTIISTLNKFVSCSFQCEPVVDHLKFDLSSLKGPHAVVTTENTPPTIKNTTWYFDPCGPLLKSSDLPADEQCPIGTQVCGIESVILSDDENIISEIIPAAGDLHGSSTDANITRLSNINDPEHEAFTGLKVELHGGKWKPGKKITSVIEFICDEDAKNPVADDSTDVSSPIYDPNFTFVSWDQETVVLRWRTPYACKDKAGDDKGDNDDDKDGKDGKDGKDKDDKDGKDDNDNDDKNNGNHWGWFTWLFIISVLIFAGYVIAGSWINYNRYGNVGIDILPHSETIRDIPYILRDFVKKIGTTFSGERPGYSAV